MVTIGDKTLNLAYTDQGVMAFSSGGYVVSDLTPPSSAVFTDMGELFSNRGYIWANTIPILKETIFVGTGPDTFAFVFPQNDIIGKTNNFKSSQILVDKPHNMYLQIAINTGVISLVALLIFFAIYGIWTIVLYRNGTLTTYADFAAVGIFVGVVAYLISGIGNDSIVAIAPVFWVLLGVGISLNFKKRQDTKVVRHKTDMGNNVGSCENIQKTKVY
jgi:O-antigen ligase